MIESEEKRERLTNLITRWAKFTKAKVFLRQDDIPSLVEQILNEFYHITLSCGHLVKDFKDSVDLTFMDQDKEGEPCEVSGTYCKECAEKYKKELGANEVKSDE